MGGFSTLGDLHNVSSDEDNALFVGGGRNRYIINKSRLNLILF
jgi:hypothetical protein